MISEAIIIDPDAADRYFHIPYEEYLENIKSTYVHLSTKIITIDFSKLNLELYRYQLLEVTYRNILEIHFNASLMLDDT